VVARDGTVVVEADPLCLLVESVAHWNVEVGDFAIVEYVAGGGVVEGVLIVKDALFEVMDSILVPFGCDSGGGFPIGDSLQEPIGNASE
jgi:hypothetical protein